ncbi:uncharacterized protein L201_004581 [Kwoniella dendrophila CBS 6074]|uniref:Short-chain dehydrogenase n=1 Tax=Kwoniella dendrophila CBS 6074 TaxID=1295534 RepID=A0AAX4JW90_9TREE
MRWPRTVSKIALILGTGANIGQATVNNYKNSGYRVATVSRTAQPTTDTTEKNSIVHFTADFADPSSIEPIFDQVQTHFGAAPDVVIYNAALMIITPTNPFDIPLTDFTKALNINTVSPYYAAGVAYARNNKIIFIYTGNGMNTMLDPKITSLGIGKAGSAHFIEEAAKEEFLRPAQFYYCDQRRLDGTPCYTGLSGQAHADLYIKLAQNTEQADPLIVFRA